jgi:hypothetical protein
LEELTKTGAHLCKHTNIHQMVAIARHVFVPFPPSGRHLFEGLFEIAPGTVQTLPQTFSAVASSRLILVKLCPEQRSLYFEVVDALAKIDSGPPVGFLSSGGDVIDFCSPDLELRFHILHPSFTEIHESLHD